MSKKNKNAKLIETFNNLEAAQKLPLFGNEETEVQVVELNTPLDLDATDMGMLRVVDVALTMNNLVKLLNTAKSSVKAAFPTNTALTNPIVRHLETALTDVLAAQADTMREVTKRSKAYRRSTKARKAKPQKYEKTYSKTKVVS